MRALEARHAREDDLREELSFCLGCRACEPVCPAGVRYGTLLEYGRDAVGMQARRSPSCAGCCWPSARARRTRLAGRIMRAGQVLGLHRIAPSRALRAAGRAAPQHRPPGRLAHAPRRRRRRRGAGRALPRLRRPPDVLGRRARGLRHARGRPATASRRRPSRAAAARCTRTTAISTARASWPTGRCARSPAARGRSSRRPAAAGPSWPTTARCSARPRPRPSAARVRDYSTLLAGRDLPCRRPAAARRLPGLLPPAQRAEGDARAAGAARLAAGRRGRRSAAAPAAAAAPPAPMR